MLHSERACFLSCELEEASLGQARAGGGKWCLSSSFMHLSFEYLLIVCMAVGLRVECVFVCG